jgi:hypothetical protein
MKSRVAFLLIIMTKRRVGQRVFIKKTNKKRGKRDGKIHLVGYRSMIIYGIYQLPNLITRI